jgi:hypothetical protein
MNASNVEGQFVESNVPLGRHETLPRWRHAIDLPERVPDDYKSRWVVVKHGGQLDVDRYNFAHGQWDQWGDEVQFWCEIGEVPGG